MLQVTNLSFKYSKEVPAVLNNLDFKIEKGEIFGFLGPSGSGKSTTQKILYKLLEGYSGEASFQGKNLKDWHRDFYEKIGVCFELPNHYQKLTAIENLRFFAAFYNRSRASIEELLDMVGLLPDANKSVGEYSKGMKVRLNFARSLLHDPEMLFLDEPTSGLDPINARNIKDIILDLKKEGKTIFLTTHNMFDADQLCDRVALLHKGHIKAMAKPSELKWQHGQRKVRVKVEDQIEEQVFEMNGLGENQSFFDIVRGGKLQTIHSEEATLEDVFIKVTGEQLV